jgi:hypothetical protein
VRAIGEGTELRRLQPVPIVSERFPRGNPAGLPSSRHPGLVAGAVTAYPGDPDSPEIGLEAAKAVLDHTDTEITEIGPADSGGDPGHCPAPPPPRHHFLSMSLSISPRPESPRCRRLESFAQ